MLYEVITTLPCNPKYRFARHDEDVLTARHLHLISELAIIGVLSHLNYLMHLSEYAKGAGQRKIDRCRPP